MSDIFIIEGILRLFLLFISVFIQEFIIGINTDCNLNSNRGFGLVPSYDGNIVFQKNLTESNCAYRLCYRAPFYITRQHLRVFYEFFIYIVPGFIQITRPKTILT